MSGLTLLFRSLSLTHRHEPPHDGGRGEAGEDVVGVGEVREVWHDDGLTPTLTPHIHLQDRHCYWKLELI